MEVGGKLPVGAAQEHKDSKVAATNGRSWYVTLKLLSFLVNLLKTKRNLLYILESARTAL